MLTYLFDVRDRAYWQIVAGGQSSRRLRPTLSHDGQFKFKMKHPMSTNGERIPIGSAKQVMAHASTPAMHAS
jgi:hypothetical protein